jgi:hypothetical protein
MRFVFTLLVCLHTVLPISAWAEIVRVRNISDYSLRQYGATLAVALLGGLVSWYAKVRKGELSPWSLMNLIGELSTSAFAGLLCFWLCEWAGFDGLITGALVGISGHMGTRGIALFEAWAQSRFGSDFGAPKP